MKKANKILSVILALVMVFSIIPITSSAATYSGSCGDNVTWTYDDTTCTLTISGTGDMYDYKSNNRPWENYEDNVKDVIISNGITTIGANAFNSCSEIKSIALSESITQIKPKAFYGCDSLISITIPNSVTIIDEYSFGVCDSLTTVILPDKLITIGDYAFAYCEKLTSVEIPNSVTTIGKRAFCGCDNLITILLPHSVVTIGERAFSLCDNLQSIKVDVNNQYYSSDEYGVLFNKDKSTLIQYPGGNTQTNYKTPDTVAEIVEWAFGHAYDLVSVIIPDSVTTIGEHAFYYCSNLVDVKIGSGITEISDWMFGECDSIVTVTIPDTITRIGDYAFYWCDNITNVIVGKKVISIGLAAFNRCYNIANIYYADEKEQWESIKTENGNDPILNATIHYNYVPTFTGIKGDYFYKDDVKQKAYQLVEFQRDFYFINDYNKIAKNKRLYLSDRFVNGFTFEDGTPLKVGYYEFDENGKMIIHNGVVGDYFYKNNERLKAYQLVEFDGDFYFINDSHKLAKNKTLYLSDRFVNGFTYEDGTPLKAGYYTFDENGKMVMLNGPVGDYFYENNVRLNAYQLVEFEGNYYFINDSHKLAKNKRIYLSQRFVEGTDLKVGYYEFDADGKLIK